MGQSLLSLVLMMKNEAKSIKQVIESAAPAVDRVDLLDTGSTDETVKIARETCAALDLPIHVYQEPFVDYATTRNRALELARPSSIFALQLSGDETLTGATTLRAFCEKRVGQVGEGANLFFLPLKVGLETLLATRLVRLGSGWAWKDEIHEFMEHQEGDRVVDFLVASACCITHKESDPERKRARFYRDLEILQKRLVADPQDARTYFYLGQTLAGLGLYADAMRFYLQRLQYGGWEEERYMSAFRAAVCANTMGRPWPEVQDLFLLASSLRPKRAEALTLLAAICKERGDYGRTYLYATLAARIPFPLYDGFGVQPDIYEWEALNLVHLSALFVGEVEVGLEATEELIRRRPEVPECHANLARYREAVRLQRSRPSPQ